MPQFWFDTYFSVHRWWWQIVRAEAYFKEPTSAKHAERISATKAVHCNMFVLRQVSCGRHIGISVKSLRNYPGPSSLLCNQMWFAVHEARYCHGHVYEGRAKMIFENHLQFWIDASGAAFVNEIICTLHSKQRVPVTMDPCCRLFFCWALSMNWKDSGTKSFEYLTERNIGCNKSGSCEYVTCIQRG